MKRLTRFTGLLLALLALSLPAMAQEMPEPIPLTAVAETDESPGDGATGPVVWLHPDDVTQSLIIGGDDNEGIALYDLSGRLLSFREDEGGIGSVDIRYGFPLGSQQITLIAGAVEDSPRIILYTIDVGETAETSTLEVIGEIETEARMASLCLYHSSRTDSFYVFGISESGVVEQYRIESEDREFEYTLARRVDVGGELENCATDDLLNRVYFADGETAVWRYGAEPEDGNSRAIVDIAVVPGLGGRITEEVEGITVAMSADRLGGYIIIANQMNNSFLVYERAGDNAFVGEFSINASDTIDGVSEPGGIGIVNVAINDHYPAGMFLTADDVNSAPNADSDFKLVSWETIAESLGLPIDTSYDPRAVANIETVMTDNLPAVTALAETAPVPSGTDAADDPAIWVDPNDPARSVIIGTNKTAGLVVYDLDGNVLQEVNIGRVNNVDLRAGVLIDGEETVVVAVTNRTENSLDLYRLDIETRQLAPFNSEFIVSSVEEVYGLCLFHRVDGALFAFVNSADSGEVEQYALTGDGAGGLAAEVVRTFVVGSQTEGCVVDDAAEILYIGEEAVGIWRYSADPNANDTREAVDVTGSDGNLTADMEGITLFDGVDGGGYLIASSQGNSTFVVYDRAVPNAYRGTFRVIEAEGVDAVSGTDGLDVTSASLPGYEGGLIVVQDDLNLDPEAGQNFKLIAWSDLVEALTLGD